LMQYDDMMEFTFGPWGDPEEKPIQGFGFKSVNVGETQISGIEFSMTGQGKVTQDITINILVGYTYMNPISLDLNKVYATVFDGTTEITYAISSSDTTVLKYRYRHLAKIDAEIVYKKLSIGASFRYNDFMQNIDKVFTDPLINDGPWDLDGDGIKEFEGIPGINDAREKFKDGDFIIDIRTGYQINKNIRLGLIINNLLNREYMSRPANMMPQRTYAMQLSMKI